MKLNITPDCGNSPKNKLIKNFSCYLASNDFESAEAFLDSNITWNWVGKKSFVGIGEFRSALKELSHSKVLELTIHSIVTHGKEAAIHGEVVLENEERFGFSDFYEFTSAKGTRIKSIVSYWVEL